MASRLSFCEEDLVCPVCMDVFKDPVVLKCNHSFCKACLHQWWEENKARECPICRDRMSEDPTTNWALKKLVTASESICGLHGERLKLFCLNDEEPICIICQTSEHHENHKLRPVKEAALKFKEEIHGALRPLQEKLEVLNKEKEKSDQAADFIKSQAECTVIQMQKEFQKLHQFLQKEEEARIAALREEEEQKSQRMKERVEKMAKEITSLTDAIRALEQEMEADDVPFLQNYRTTKNRAQYQVSDPKKASRGRIDVAKHLGNLKYRVWEKMQEIVQYTPVTLDPNSKGDNLTLSEDLTSLEFGGQAELSFGGDDEDDDDDGDDVFKGFAFGSEGFSSGKHCWDVEVGDNPVWALGVAESSSGEGDPTSRDIWAIGYGNGEYRAFSGAGKTTRVSVRREVKRVRVQLDWERGRLSFSDPTSDASLHTFRPRFTQQVSAGFFTGSGSAPLRICPLKISVTVG